MNSHVRRRRTIPWLILASLVLGLVSLSATLWVRLDPSETAAITTAPPVSADRAGIWISAAEVASLPDTGEAWDNMASYALSDWGIPDLSDQDNLHDVSTLAGALYAVRLDDAPMLGRVRDSLEEVTGTFSERLLPVGRNLVSYVVAADLIEYDETTFKEWLREVLDRPGSSRVGIRSLRESAMRDPTNHGAHARASVLAIGLFLGDAALVDSVASRFHDWLGRSGAGFEWREDHWQADPERPIGINAIGATIQGLDVDGVLPEEQRRSGPFVIPPPREGYVWEALQGAVVTAELLDRTGAEPWLWENQALGRAFAWLHDVNAFPAEGDDTWQTWLVNRRLGTDYSADVGTRPGKNMGFTDWTHADQ